MKKALKLNNYEQDLENNLEKCQKIKNEKQLKKSLSKAAKKHLGTRKPITIRVPSYDIEAIKTKASKIGIPYQTYINMLIHRDAMSL